MLVIGLTGDIGAGKRLYAVYCNRWGRVVEADRKSSRLVKANNRSGAQALGKRL